MLLLFNVFKNSTKFVLAVKETTGQAELQLKRRQRKQETEVYKDRREEELVDA